jgi:hypothetical protein
MQSFRSWLGWIVCLGTVGAGAAGVAGAAVLSTGASAGDSDTWIITPPPGFVNYYFSATFPQFNPDLGTLQMVNTRFVSYLTAYYTFGNMGESNKYFGVTASMQSQLTPSGGLAGPGAAVSGGAEIGPGTNFGQGLDDNNQNFGVITSYDPHALAAFIGHGSILMEGFASFSSNYPLEGITGYWSYGSHLNIEVQYQYEVPEPGTFVPGVVALGVICWRGRRCWSGRTSFPGEVAR